MKFFFAKYSIVVLLLLFAGAARVTPYQQRMGVIRNNSQINTVQIKHILQSVQQRYAPDLQLAVFDISYRQVEKGIILHGEVDNPEAKSAVIHALQKIVKGTVIDSIHVLPEAALGPNIAGIVTLPVADVRRRPGKQEELLTQALMGTIVTLLKKERGYFFIQTPDHYLGWLDSASMVVCNQAGVDAWNAASKVIVTNFMGVVHARTDTSSTAVCEIIDGCILKNNGRQNGWIAVERADGKNGFVPESLVQDLDEWKRSRVPTGENLEKTARSFLGIRYLWGGMSVKGMDCSGFVKTVYHLNGVELNRDARQQAQQGKPIEPGENFQNLEKGDLLFFGRKATAKRQERITHVALYLENGLYLHSSKRVRVSSLNPSSDYYEEPLLKKFVRARRILQN
ncbi:MAG: C40 family peptidase [Ignavibacteriales bacterium]|nr:C40 family peptidase [Ignavibacteriales bacterium]